MRSADPADGRAARRRRQQFTFALLLALLAATALALPRPKEKWVRVRTPNFTLIGDAPTGRVIELAHGLERLRAVLALTASEDGRDASLRIRIFAFENDQSFRPYKLDSEGKPRNISGYFAASEDGRYVALDAAAGHGPLSTLQHEYVHAWLEASFPELPLWVNEGLAEFYSTFAASGDTAEIGRHVDAHLLWLADHPLLPLQELFAITLESPDYNEGERQGTFYAQSWALTHYLLVADESRRDRFGAFLARWVEGQDATEALTEAFETNLSSLERELRDYVRQAAFRFNRITLAEAPVIQDAAVEALSHSEVLFLLGDLLVHSPPVQAAAAAEHLHAALELKPRSADAWASLGVLRLSQDDAAAAEELFRKSVELEPDNGRCRWLLGSTLVERYLLSLDPTLTPPEQTPPLLLEARGQLERALELEPGHGPALAALAQTYVLDPQPGPDGVTVAASAYRAQPTRTELLAGLVMVTANSGNPAGARSLLERSLRPRGKAELTRAAEAAVAKAETLEAIARFEAGEREEAEAMLRRTKDATTDPELRRAVEEQLAELTAAATGQDEAARYNRAVAAAQGGNTEEAIAELEGLVETATVTGVRSAAELSLAEIRRVQAQRALVDRFNEAVTLAQSGQVEPAIAVVEEVLAAGPEPRLREAAERALAELRSLVKR